ncbi:MAG TPA: hypothetical protein VGH91_06435 [Gammaproteobacteria bacterium]
MRFRKSLGVILVLGMLVGCGGNSAPPDITGSYAVRIFGYPTGKYAQSVVAYGVMVISEKPLTDEALPAVPPEEAKANQAWNTYTGEITQQRLQEAFAGAHYLGSYSDPKRLDVCIWLRKGEIDDDLTSLVSFVLTTHDADKGKIYIPLYRSPDSFIGIDSIRTISTGFEGIVNSRFDVYGHVDNTGQRFVAVRDNRVTMKDCLEDGVHIAVAQDYLDDGEQKARGELFNWFYNKKKPETKSR